MQHISYHLWSRLTKLALEIDIHVISAWRSRFSLFDHSGLRDSTAHGSAATPLISFTWISLFHIKIDPAEEHSTVRGPGDRNNVACWNQMAFCSNLLNYEGFGVSASLYLKVMFLDQYPPHCKFFFNSFHHALGEIKFFWCPSTSPCNSQGSSRTMVAVKWRRIA